MTITDVGLTYEADPRHCDLLSSSLNLADASSAATPRVKPMDRDEHAIKSNELEKVDLSDYSDPDKVIAAICRGAVESKPDPAECTKPFPRKSAGSMNSVKVKLENEKINGTNNLLKMVCTSIIMEICAALSYHQKI